MKPSPVNRSLVNRDSVPALYPTHFNTPEFWEHLGRAIGACGFLEEVLGKAIFAITATREYNSEEIEAAYQEWLPQLEQALTDQLWNLAEKYGRAARDNAATTTENISELVDDIKKVVPIRNALCHGSWRPPDNNGSSIPFFVNRKMQKFDTAIDIEFLKDVRAHVAGLAFSVIDTVTHMGWLFPGGAGPGTPIMEFR